MSATVSPPASAPASQSDQTWSRTLIGVLNLAILAALAVFAYVTKSQEAINLLMGAAIANATAVVQFYFGSSTGDQRKDATISHLMLKGDRM